MIYDMLFKVDTKGDVPISELGDNHIMIYDNSKKCFYITTRESFLKPQLDEIASLKAKIDCLEAENKEFKKEITTKINSFLADYKETNAKMIKMIKTFYLGENSDEENN